MKIAILTDTHHGIKNDSPIIHQYMEKFYSNIFFPYIDEHNIRHVLHLGDLVDKRKYVTGITLNRIRLDFIEPLLARNLECHILVGNHDSTFKNKLTPNFITEILGDNHEGIFCYDKPTYLKINNLDFLMLPWICSETYDESIHMIKEQKAHIVAGHLELSGFQMYRGHAAKEGMNPNLFDSYHMVLSGHYHTRSSHSGIHYLGTPLDFTWSDWNDPKGFHILDTDTKELTFIQNPNNIELHKQIIYNEQFEYVFHEYENCIVKVIIQNEYDQHKFDQFISRLSDVVYQYSIEDLTISKYIEIDSEQIKVSDTLTIFKQFLNDNKLDSLIESIYTEAITLK